MARRVPDRAPDGCFERLLHTMARAGFRGVLQGVAMLRDNAEGYNRPDAFVLDDWR